MGNFFNDFMDTLKNNTIVSVVMVALGVAIGAVAWPKIKDMMR